jgi:hypothetical protein
MSAASGNGGVLEELRFLVFRIGRQGERVVCGSTAAEEQDEVSGILACLGIGGAGGGEGSEKVKEREVGFGTGVRVYEVVSEGTRAAEEASEEMLHCCRLRHSDEF